MMTIQHSYSILFKRWGLMLFCLLAFFLPVSAGNIIDEQPKSETKCQKDGGVIFSVTLKSPLNEGDYKFLWHKWEDSNWVPITGASGRIYTPPFKNGKYMCIVTEKINANNYEQSKTAELIVNDVPIISNIKVSPVCEGDNLVASVTGVNINGSDLLSYVWKLGGDSIKGSPTTGSVVPELKTAVTYAQNNRFITITVRNSCGQTVFPSSDKTPIAITVRQTPSPPKVNVRNYCQGEKAVPLSIESGNDAVWYNKNKEVISTPVPKTDNPGVQKWWVAERVTYTDNGNYFCESDTVVAKVEVFPTPAAPARVADTTLCINDPSITLKVKSGTNIQWYNDMKQPLSTAPQINTSKLGIQTYYVTQRNENCESPKENGKMTVDIRGRSDTVNIKLSYNPELCPNTSTIIFAEAKVTNPIFKWYIDSKKSVQINNVPGNGSIFETPVLSKDTSYYVSIQYGGLCESIYAHAAVLTVRDFIPPKIAPPPNVVVRTDAGVCYATSVDPGFPVVSDNCTPEHKLIVTSSPDINLINRYELGDTTLIWWVKDEVGNMDYALQNVSVRDRQKPWANNRVQDIVKVIDENEDSAVAYYDWNYEDNCTPASELIDSLYRGLPSGSVFPLGETQIIRYIIDKAGNIDTCKFKVIVKYPERPLNLVSLRVNNNPICPNQEVVITPVISGGRGKITYFWNKRSWTGQIMRDYPTEDTTYEVTISDGVTTLTESVPVKILKTRKVGLTLTVEGRPISMDEIFEGDEVLVTATTDFDAYKLMLNNEVIQEVGINNNVSFQAELGTYVVKVFATDENFCVTQDQMIIEVDSKKLPNVFTPNFDGKNDKFLEFLETPHSPEDFHLQVYSRAGELLFKGNTGWDGTYKGKVMPQGTYSYVVRRKMKSGVNRGEYRVFKGYVTIKL